MDMFFYYIMFHFIFSDHPHIANYNCKFSLSRKFKKPAHEILNEINLLIIVFFKSKFPCQPSYLLPVLSLFPEYRRLLVYTKQDFLKIYDSNEIFFEIFHTVHVDLIRIIFEINSGSKSGILCNYFKT